MSFTSWLRNIRSALSLNPTERKHRRRSLRPAIHRPQLELLEDRCTPSTYSVTDLGTLGGYYSYASDLNQAGQVVGSTGTTDGFNRAFLWENGTMIDLGSLGGGYSWATAVNDLGQVVGGAFLPDSTYHAFLVNPQGGVWFQDSDLDGRNDFMIDLGTLNGTTDSEAADINNAGQVVGNSGDRGFLWDADTGMTDLGTPLGFTYISASGINEAGQVTGSASYYVDGNHNSAFLWDAANGMTILGAGGAYTDSLGAALNDAGQVVGNQWDAAAVVDPAFLWTPDSLNGLTGSFTDLGMLSGAINSNAFAVNNAGQVVGSSTLTETVLVEQTVVVEETVLVEEWVEVDCPPCPPGTVCGYGGCWELYSHYETQYVYVTSYSYETYYYSHAFLWDAADGMVDLQNQLLPDSGATLRDAQAVNDGGSIAVNGYNGGGDRAFLLTPVHAVPIADAPAVTEGNAGTADAAFTVTLSEASDQIITVDFATAAGSAAAGSDFVPTSGTLTFLPGETSKPITVQVRGDLLNEYMEYFTVNLSNPANASINLGQGMGTILDDDPMPTLAVNDVQVTEGNSGTTDALHTVSLSAPSGRWVSVYYSTANSTATAGSDYQVQSGWLTFAPGQLTQTITGLVNGDTLHETDETISVNLSSPANATLADAQGVGTILNDDPVTLAISDATLKEGNSGTTNFVFTVTLSEASDQDVTVHFTTANDSAIAGSDYTAASGTLTIPAGQISGTISVLVNGDTLNEANETFVVNLSNATNAVITDGQSMGTILNDEIPQISITYMSVIEGSSASRKVIFTVTLSSACAETVTVNFATANGTATTGDHDYQGSSGTLTFAPGETTKTITILVYGDKKKESNETFFVDLFGNSSNSVITKNRGIGTILNDD